MAAFLYRPKGHITQLSPYLAQKPDWRGRGTPNTGSYHVPQNPAYLATWRTLSMVSPQTSTHDLYSANHLTMVSRPVATMRIPPSLATSRNRVFCGKIKSNNIMRNAIKSNGTKDPPRHAMITTSLIATQMPPFAGEISPMRLSHLGEGIDLAHSGL